MFTYVCIDKYLRDAGKLGFLITKTVFKAKGQAEGFRRFRLGATGRPFSILRVDDLSLLKPFEGASNLTSCFVALKGKETSYPVPFWIWVPKPGSHINPDLQLRDIRRAVTCEKFDARPLTNHEGSQWQTTLPNQSQAISKLMGRCSYKASVGARVEPYGVFLLRVITPAGGGNLLVQNLFDAGKRVIPSVQAQIEPDLLYPIVRGRDIQRWHCAPSSVVLMVQDPNTRQGYDEQWLKKQYQLTYRYLAGFRSVLESRAAYKKYHAEGRHPFYSMFNISEETFAPYKVAWRRMGNDLRACVLSKYKFEPMKEKLVIASDTVTIVSFDSETEALYLVALLNSVPARAAVYSYSPSGRGLGTPAILKDLRIENYNSRNSLHRSIASIGKELTEHHARSTPVPQAIAKSEELLNKVTAEYWGLNQTEFVALKEAVETRELGASGGHAEKIEEDIHSRMFDIGTSTEE